jgi:uncharacterized RDD family membrane protein YckC
VSGWAQPASTEARGTAGFVYADVPNRVIAVIIDGVILVIINAIVGALLTPIIGPTANFVPGTSSDPFSFSFSINPTATIISSIVDLIISGIYFVGSWVTWRATPGQRVLGMQVGNETDGATLTPNQAVIRWLLLGAPFGLLSALSGISGLTGIIGLIAIIWFIVLLVTTARSPTKQGLHDQYAHTVVVKSARIA